MLARKFKLAKANFKYGEWRTYALLKFWLRFTINLIHVCLVTLSFFYLSMCTLKYCSQAGQEQKRAKICFYQKELTQHIKTFIDCLMMNVDFKRRIRSICTSTWYKWIKKRERMKVHLDWREVSHFVRETEEGGDERERESLLTSFLLKWLVAPTLSIEKKKEIEQTWDLWYAKTAKQNNLYPMSSAIYWLKEELNFCLPAQLESTTRIQLG